MKKLSTQGGCQGGQENKWNKYCPSCHSYGNLPHEKGCKDHKVYISATARIPRKDASKRVWDAFYRKFVLNEDILIVAASREKEKIKRVRRNTSLIAAEKREAKKKKLVKDMGVPQLCSIFERGFI